MKTRKKTEILRNFTIRLKGREALEKEASERRPPASTAAYIQYLLDTHPERKTFATTKKGVNQ